VLGYSNGGHLCLGTPTSGLAQSFQREAELVLLLKSLWDTGNNVVRHIITSEDNAE